MMKYLLSPFAILLAAFALLVGCSKNEPTGNGGTPIDTTHHTNPIDTLGPCQVGGNAAITQIGFIIDGDGFNNEVINLDPGKTITEQTPDFIDTTITLSMNQSVKLASNDTANITLTVKVYDVANASYNWIAPDSLNPSGVTIRIDRAGSSKLYQPVLGSTKVITSKINAAPYRGTFCGYAKDSVTKAQVSIKSGKYLVN